MKRKIIIMLMLLAFCFVSIGQAEAFVAVDFNFFVGDLNPYGTWVYAPNYGEVWYPADEAPGWRPYEVGHWVWTDDGWMWMSDEPWGLTYHYGRWVYDPPYGWVWMPGAVWAPAWVSWYVGPDYIGWAPLPPVGFGIVIAPAYCSFVSFGSFLSINLGDDYVPVSQNVAIFRTTTNINNITVVNNTVVDPGPSASLVERRTGRTLQRASVVSAGDPKMVNRHEGNRVYAYRPVVRASSRYHTPLLSSEARGTVRVGGRRLFVRSAAAARLHARQAARVNTRRVAQANARHEARMRSQPMRRPAQQIRRSAPQTQRPARQMQRSFPRMQRQSQPMQRPMPQMQQRTPQMQQRMPQGARPAARRSPGH